MRESRGNVHLLWRTFSWGFFRSITQFWTIALHPSAMNHRIVSLFYSTVYCQHNYWPAFWHANTLGCFSVGITALTEHEQQQETTTIASWAARGARDTTTPPSATYITKRFAGKNLKPQLLLLLAAAALRATQTNESTGHHRRENHFKGRFKTRCFFWFSFQ